jgi:hypothetical protein
MKLFNLLKKTEVISLDLLLKGIAIVLLAMSLFIYQYRTNKHIE